MKFLGSWKGMRSVFRRPRAICRSTSMQIISSRILIRSFMRKYRRLCVLENIYASLVKQGSVS